MNYMVNVGNDNVRNTFNNMARLAASHFENAQYAYWSDILLDIASIYEPDNKCEFWLVTNCGTFLRHHENEIREMIKSGITVRAVYAIVKSDETFVFQPISMEMLTT